MGGFRGICLPAPLKWVGKPVLQLPVINIKRYCRHITTTTSVIKACIHRHTYTHIAQVLQKNRHSNTKKNNNLASVKKRTIAKIFLKNFENTHKNFDPSSSFEVHMRWHRFHAPNAPWPPFLAAKLSSD